MATRRSSRSNVFTTTSSDLDGSLASAAGVEGSPGSTSYPTPSFTRPGSETASGANVALQSCSSALSGGAAVDDGSLDDILADGVHGQPLAENGVTRELASHADLRAAAEVEELRVLSAQEVSGPFPFKGRGFQHMLPCSYSTLGREHAIEHLTG